MKKRSWSSKLADYLTSYFGSANFLLINIIIFALWIVVNTGVIPFLPIFDPYPFVLLITFVSLEAIILTTVVLMSQKRQSTTDIIREELQLQVELITEKEMTKMLQLLKLLLEKQGVKIEDEELDEMVKKINTSYIERKLEKELHGEEKVL